MVQCIMFDFDDTIYNFSEAIKNTIFYIIKHSNLNYDQTQAFLRAIKKHNNKVFHKVNSYSETSEYIVDKEFIDSAFDYYNIFLNAMNTVSDIYISRQEYDSYFLSNCKLFEGVADTLETLKASGKTLVLLSDGILKEKIKILRHLELEKMFDLIITSDQINRIKPDTKFFNALLYWMTLDLSKCIYIGNHISDYFMAKRVGIEFYAHNADNLLERYLQEKSILHIDTFTDIIDLESKKKNA